MSLAGIEQYATCTSATLFARKLLHKHCFQFENNEKLSLRTAVIMSTMCNKVHYRRCASDVSRIETQQSRMESRFSRGSRSSVNLLLNSTVNTSKTEHWWGQRLNELTFGLRFVSVVCTVTSYQSKNFLTILITVVSSNWSRMNPSIFSGLRWNCLNCGFTTLMLISSF